MSSYNRDLHYFKYVFSGPLQQMFADSGLGYRLQLKSLQGQVGVRESYGAYGMNVASQQTLPQGKEKSLNEPVAGILYMCTVISILPISIMD